MPLLSDRKAKLYRSYSLNCAGRLGALTRTAVRLSTKVPVETTEAQLE